MEKKRILFLMACFLMMSSAWGAPISLQHAKTVAGDFMAKRVKNAGNMKLTHQATLTVVSLSSPVMIVCPQCLATVITDHSMRAKCLRV